MQFRLYNFIPWKNNENTLYSKHILALAENTKSNTNEILCHLLGIKGDC